MKQAILFLSFLVIITSCKKDNDITPDGDGDVILQEEAVIIEASSDAQLESVENSRLLFSDVNEQLDKIKIGNVLVAAPSDKAPYGYLRKVTRVEKTQGKLILTTEDAELTELIKEAKGSFRRTITPDDISRSTTFEEIFKKFLYDGDNNNATVKNNLTIDGSHNFTLDFLFDIDIKDSQVNYIKAGIEIENEINFTVMAGPDVDLDDYKKELEILRHKIKPILFSVGGVPIVLNSNIYSKVGVSGNFVSGVSGSTWRKVTTTAYIEYIDKEWRPFNEKKIEEKKFELDAKVGAEIEGFLGVGVEFKFYNSKAATSDFRIDAYLKGEAICSAQELTCIKRLKVGLRASGNIKVKLFKRSIVDYTNALFDVCTIIDEDEIDHPSPTTTPDAIDPIPPDGFRDERDDQVYKWTKIGNQTWMAENLNYVSPNTNLVEDCANCGQRYGLDKAKVSCPDGWHLPSDDEWKELETYLGMSQNELDLMDDWRGTDEGGKLKSTNLWETPNIGATNSSNFNAIPATSMYCSSENGGPCHSDGLPPGSNGIFNYAAYFISSTKSGGKVIVRQLSSSESKIKRFERNTFDRLSCRCVKDN